MTKIKCPSGECKYNSKSNICQAKTISLSWQSIMTKWEGRQEYWKCKEYEPSDKYKELEQQFKKMIEERE